MRVAVSGVPGDVTSCVVDELRRRGHQVVAASKHDDTVGALVHLADNGGRSADGAALRAAQLAGIPRIVAVCPAGARWPTGTPSTSTLLIRTAPALGRATTGATQRRFAAPVIVGVKGRRNTVRFVHHDDLARFTADAVEHPQWTGQVDLAARDAVTLRKVAALLGKPYLEPDLGRWAELTGRFGLGGFELADQPLDTTRLAELGFVPARTSHDCVTEFRRANRQHIYVGPVRMAMPWRFPWLPTPPPRQDGPHRHPASDSGLGGEFDTTVDPDWPAFTSANIAEAFPGPMTPLSLELTMEALRATGVLAADIVGVKGELHRAMTEEHIGCFGHSVYVNLTVSHAASAMLPGADPSTWRNLLFGAGSGIDAGASGKISLLGMVARLPKIVILLTGSAGETHRIEAQARDRQRDAAYFSRRTDHQLHSQLRCVRDEVANSWAVAALGSAGVVPIMGLIERLAGKRHSAQFKGGVEDLASAGLLRGTYDLAEYARAEPDILAILGGAASKEALTKLHAEHPDFTARIDTLIAEYGHRGPRETELSSQVFADTPARLLDAVAKLASSRARPVQAVPPMGPGLRLLARLGAEFQQSRERARDAAMRHTNNYRLIARELGSRLVTGGVIDEPGDVFYLTRDELTNPPDDIAARVSRRKAERARLARYRLPRYFTERWEPRHDTAGELKPGESLTGIPASAGSAKGRVRILQANSIDELQPGEVLVAECTDTGWTPFFSYAAAVVVDTGAEMSHAAVIAREFDIPCVVGAVAASRVLRTGDVIEVDGSVGRITRVD